LQIKNNASGVCQAMCSQLFCLWKDLELLALGTIAKHGCFDWDEHFEILNGEVKS
jgi:hypothetical protein